MSFATPFLRRLPFALAVGAVAACAAPDTSRGALTPTEPASDNVSAKDASQKSAASGANNNSNNGENYKIASCIGRRVATYKAVFGPEQLAAGQRAENAGDYIAAVAAYVAVAAVPDERLAVQAYFCLGRVKWRQGRFDAALKSFEDARALAERLGDIELVARTDNGVGAVHYARGDYAAARRAYAAAQARTSDPAMRGKVILNLGVIENIESNFETAREHYKRAYELFSESGDSESAMLALHNQGMVEADLQRWNDADRSFLAALEIATELGNKEMIAKALVNRSEVLVERGELAEAVDHCDRALQIYAVVGDEVGRGE